MLFQRFKIYKALIIRCFIFLFTCSASNASLAIQDVKNNKSTVPLRIAVSSNFTSSLKKLIPKFTENTGIKITIVSGSTGSLYQQIRHGAPYDIFLSADAKHPQTLHDLNFASEQSLHTYAQGLLVFYSLDKHLTFSALQQVTANIHKFSIANPRHAPYGAAAKQALTNLEQWQTLQPKIVMGNNVIQSFQHIQSQAASAGLVAASLVIAQQEIHPENYVPLHLYQPIEQKMVILKSSKQQTKAQLFQDYLLSNATQEKLLKWGYLKAHG